MLWARFPRSWYQRTLTTIRRGHLLCSPVRMDGSLCFDGTIAEFSQTLQLQCCAEICCSNALSGPGIHLVVQPPTPHSIMQWDQMVWYSGTRDSNLGCSPGTACSSEQLQWLLVLIVQEWIIMLLTDSGHRRNWAPSHVSLIQLRIHVDMNRLTVIQQQQHYTYRLIYKICTIKINRDLQLP